MRKIFATLVCFLMVLMFSGKVEAVLDLTANTLVITGNTNTTNLSVSATTYFGGTVTMPAALTQSGGVVTLSSTTVHGTLAVDQAGLFSVAGTSTLTGTTTMTAGYTVTSGTCTISKGAVSIVDPVSISKGSLTVGSSGYATKLLIYDVSVTTQSYCITVTDGVLSAVKQ